jgi:anthraniloyl-CoA monooxygenase
VKTLVLGGGPGGLYSAILLKKRHPDWAVRVIERNPADATYGFGVVFSDRAMSAFHDADYPSYRGMTERFALWDTIEVRYAGDVVRCGGNVFAGVARRVLLGVLQERCRELGVELEFGIEVGALEELPAHDLLIAADGVNSLVRRVHAAVFRPTVSYGRLKFIWLGTTKLFDAFTFIFRETPHGRFQAHVYPNDGDASTFIVLCSEATWRAARLDRLAETETLAYLGEVFAADLTGQPMLSNRSQWISFCTVGNRTWRHGSTVLLGDAAHTADFTIGAGSKLAMEDAIALADAFERHEAIGSALRDYELERRPVVTAMQQAAAESSHYFENLDRYAHFETMQFAYYLLTRSGRISYTELRRRDPSLVDAVDRWFFARHTDRTADLCVAAPPPMCTPMCLRELRLTNRLAVSSPPDYGARDGLPPPHRVGGLDRMARSGAGLILTDLVAVSAEGRITPGCSGLYTAEQEAAWRGLIEIVHRGGDAKIGVRLSHAGRRGATRPRWDGVDRPLRENGWPLVSASALPYTAHSQVPQEATPADMDRIVAAFVGSAERAAAAGFDVLELCFAHGYLLASFISPLSNRRTDEWGGSVENRLRFPLAVFEAVRQVWPAEKPMVVALSATDWIPDGSTVDEAVGLARALVCRGCDAVEVLAGQTTADALSVYDPGMLIQLSDRIRNEALVATLVTGCVRLADDVNSVVASGRADLCFIDPPEVNAHLRPVHSPEHRVAPAPARAAGVAEAAHA